MVTYRKARPEERVEIIDLANYVFSQAHCPHDFKTLLPKIYDDRLNPQIAAECHCVADVDGKIKAMVSCPNLPITYAGETFTLGLIGTVSVHPYARHEGYMRKLMDFTMRDSEDRGADMLILGGQHQRYQHFGFEFAGSAYNFIVSPASVRHAWKDVSTEGITLRTMTEDDPLLDRAFALYQKEPVTGMRTREGFYAACVSWNYVLTAILRDGKFAGYLTSSPEGDVGEILVNNDALRNAALKAWSQKLGRDFTVCAFPYQADRIADWMANADRFNIENQEMIKVLHWLPVLRAALALRCVCGNADDGEAVLELDGKKYLLSVKDGKSSVEETDRPADAAFCGPEAVRKLFGLGVAVCPGLNVLHNNWLPLPFNIPFTDKF